MSAGQKKELPLGGGCDGVMSSSNSGEQNSSVIENTPNWFDAVAAAGMKPEVDPFAGLLGPAIGFAISLSDSPFFDATLEDLWKI